MTRDIVQTLIDTRVEHEIDVDAYVEQLADAGLLTERQAEALVRAHLTNTSVAEIAEAMGISESRIYNARQAADAKILEAEETLGLISSARREVQPDPYE